MWFAVSFPTDGTDYTHDTVTVTFQPGQVQASVDVSILDDDVLESVEMFSATLTSNEPNVDVSSDDTAEILIDDNDSMLCGSNICCLLITAL